MPVKNNSPFNTQIDFRKLANPTQEVVNQAMAPVMERFRDAYSAPHLAVLEQARQGLNPMNSLGIDRLPGLNKSMSDTMHGLGTGGGVARMALNPVIPGAQSAGASIAAQVTRSGGFSNLAKSASDRVSSLLAQVSAGARMSALTEEISRTMAGQQDIYDPVIRKVGRTLDFYQPSTLEKAISLVRANPEAVEATRELVEEHPKEAQALASKVSSDDNRDSSPDSDLSNAAVALPWLGAFNDISAATFNGTTGASLAYTAFTSLLLAILTSWVISLEQNKNSPKQIDPPEEK